MDLVSIVITTYKREPETVERAIQSVVQQSYRPIEIIVVDDSPSEYPYRPAIRNLADKYRNLCDIAYYPHERNMGACAARNTGLHKSKGTYIGFLDDDDEYDHLKVEKQAEILSKNSSIQMVYCNCAVVDDETGEKTYSQKKLYRGKVFDKLIEQNFIGTTSFPLIRRDCLTELGGFDVQLPACQDYDMWLRVCKENSVDYIDEPLVIYHNHKGEQITKDPRKRITGLLRIMEKNEDYLNSHNKAWVLFRIKLVNEYIRLGKSGEAFRLLSLCLLRYPWLLRIYIPTLGRIMKKALAETKSYPAKRK